MKRLRSILALFSAAILLTPSLAAAQAPDAKGLYAQHCARCHGDTGHGDGPAHTMQRPWPRDFTTGVYKFRSTPSGTLPLRSDVERVIAQGIPRTSMPGYGKWLSQEEIRALADYVLRFSSGSGVPDGADSAVRIPGTLLKRPHSQGLLDRGKDVFVRNCAACHGPDGRGLGELAGTLRDKDGFLINPVDLTDALGYGGGSRAGEIYKTLSTGITGSPMPDFSQTLADADREAVAAYVESIQVGPDRRTVADQQAWSRALGPVERGEYLVRAMSCALCHNSYDEDGAYYVKPYLAGGVNITIPGLGSFPTRNITSHSADGLGRWTEDEVIRVITTGHAPDRRIEAFSMPWVYFSHLTEQDARDVAAYVKSLKPIENRVPPRTYDPIWKRLWTRMRQLVGLEHGRLEYPSFNVGSRRSQAEMLDARRRRQRQDAEAGG